MSSIDIQKLQTQFIILWCEKVQKYTEYRKSKMSQREWAKLTGKSLKTIQRFENYDCFNSELMYLYSKLS